MFNLYHDFINVVVHFYRYTDCIHRWSYFLIGLIDIRLWNYIVADQIKEVVLNWVAWKMVKEEYNKSEHSVMCFISMSNTSKYMSWWQWLNKVFFGQYININISTTIILHDFVDYINNMCKNFLVYLFVLAIMG